MIQLKQISIQRGTKPLLEKADLEIFAQNKVAVIGANGCGKSSLFSALQHDLQLDNGEILMPKEWRVVEVEQEVVAGNAIALDYVISGDKALTKLRNRLSKSDNLAGEELASLHDELALHGHYDAESRASIILAGLRFTEDNMTQPVNQFSGGWQMRLNLARALFCPSDLLLLDEPTNHLDLDAIIWLEEWLKTYQGTLILISHDQSFIDSTVQYVVSFEEKNLCKYTGGYSSYEQQRAQKIKLVAAEHAKQQQKRQHLESFITRFKAKASKAKQAQSRIKQLQKMQETLPLREQAAFSFDFLAPEKLPNPLIRMEALQLGYTDKPILNDVQFNLVPGSRIGLLGKNGAGKSTFMKFLAGKLKPLQGDVAASAGLSIGYFTQYQIDALSFDDSPLMHIQRLSPLVTEQSIRDYLGGFGFHGDQALASVGNMSGGEKARVVLAILVWQRPNLLLLDEPTNHLDIGVRQALTFALQSFEGALVLVSHDRYLLESVCDDFYLVNAGQLQPFDGNLDDYRTWILKTDSTTKKDSIKNDHSAVIDRKAEKRRAAELRQKLSPYKKSLQQTERQISSLNKALKVIEDELADENMYRDENKSMLKQHLHEQKELKQKLSTHEEQWLALVEEIEHIENQIAD